MMTPRIVLTVRPCTGRIFLPYGELYRNSDGTIWRPWFARDGVHRGDDYEAYQLPIYAAHPGICVVADDGDGWGRYVKIKHKDGWETISAHLLKALVKNGQKVEAGDQIGISGDSGSASGNPHFHHELRACFLKLPDTGPRCQQAPSQFYAAQPPIITPPPPNITPPPYEPPSISGITYPLACEKWKVVQYVYARSAPGTSNPMIGGLNPGDIITATEGIELDPYSVWLKHSKGWSAFYHGMPPICYLRPHV